MNNKTILTTLQMTLLTGAAVISLRGLPMMAMEGLTIFFFIAFASILFLIPTALISAELGSALSDKEGGIYAWVKEAFGEKWGFLEIWLLWAQNVTWYPVILGFVCVTLSYAFGKPEFAQNGFYIGIAGILLYWTATLITFKGNAIIAKVVDQGFLLGTCLPGIVLVVIAIVWIAKGHPIHFLNPSEVHHAIAYVNDAGQIVPRFLPKVTGMGDIAFLAGLVLLFAGVEVHAINITKMQKPKTQFPIAILIASILCIVIFSLGSLSIATVIPQKQIGLTAGLMDAFKIIFTNFNLPSWILNIMALLVAFGSFAGIISWTAGPSRGMLKAAQDGMLPKVFAKTNENGIEKNILLTQGVIVSLLMSVYIFMDSVDLAFFLITTVTAGLYLFVYILMYIAAIYLKIKKPDMPRPYSMPGGKAGGILIALVGLAAVLFALGVSFFPPSDIPVSSPKIYVALVVFGTIGFSLIPFGLHYRYKGSKK
ncbi:Amino acid permease [Elusimicrobium minutum Pei191]|uniref:Amino acid permease n=1 Tax=Elusimicrobium minutum (strain Pei191) TaxID=445932 RepID=B2KCL7_ELUMP|nr:amino acid permease [Elusimicrobium minutum]ACC98263.1 Amino acid permease [Elusimicrobium minutum Pei191]